MAGETKAASSKKSDHPPYEAMIKSAVLALKERRGSSRPAIKKYILANYAVTAGGHFDSQIAAAIKRGTAKNIFALPRGLSGTVKLAKPEKKTVGEKKEKKESKPGAADTTSPAPAAKKAAPKTKKSPAAPVKKTAAVRKAAIAKKQPTKQKTAAKEKVKAPKKKAATTTTTKRAGTTKRKAAGKA